MDCREALKTRRSIRAYTGEPVSREAVENIIAQAAVCVAVLCKDTKYYLEDGCYASQNILVAARGHGLGACWVAGDKKYI
jgi:nitroreductase